MTTSSTHSHQVCILKVSCFFCLHCPLLGTLLPLVRAYSYIICAGWFEPSTAGMQLRNITVATTVSIGCLPTSILSGPSVTSLQVVPAPSYGKFPNIQKAMNCPIPAFPDEQLATGYSGSDVPYSTIKQMQVLRIDATRSVLDLASLGCSTDGCDLKAVCILHNLLIFGCIKALLEIRLAHWWICCAGVSVQLSRQRLLAQYSYSSSCWQGAIAVGKGTC